MDITMPQLGETVTEGTIIKWVKNVGDSVAVDETLFEVSTDKVDSEVPSPVAGVLSEIIVQEGDVAEVGQKLAVISDSGSDSVVTDTPTGSSLSASESSTPADVRSEPVEVSSLVTADTKEQTSAASAETTGSARPEGREAVSSVGSAGNAKGKLASPLVRKLINDNGLDANTIVGTGANGRITRDDVNAAIAASGVGVDSSAQRTFAGSAGSETESVAGGSAPIAQQIPASAPVQVTRPSTGDTVLPFDNVRRRTAEHMVRSKATSPHAYMSVEVDFENIERVRQANKVSFKERNGFSLTYLPFIIRALSEVLPDFPDVNASVDGDNLVIHNDFHVGIAVDIDQKALIVPALRNADGKRLHLIAQEVRDLATRARSKQLKPDEIVGSTFTITNPGPYGSFQTFPIINQPQVAILATDGVTKRPVVVQDEYGQDVIAIHHMGMLTLGWDHRAFDGGYTANFLARLKEVLQDRDWQSELV